MSRKSKLKSVLASILVTVALAAPIMVFSGAVSPTVAELYFEIDREDGLVLHSDGKDSSVQLLVNIAVDKTVNCRGASFHLRYNKEYLAPSYIADRVDASGSHKANDFIDPADAEDSTDRNKDRQNHDGFFREDKDLFGLKDSSKKQINVFKQLGGYDTDLDGNLIRDFYSHVDTAEGTIDMELWFDNNVIFDALDADDGTVDGEAAAGAGKITRLSGATMSEGDKIYVFNKYDENEDTNQTAGKVILGQLSFRVKKGRLPEIIDLFDGLSLDVDYRDPATFPPARPYVDVNIPNATLGKTKVGETFLLDIDQDVEDPWQIGYYGDRGGNVGEAGDRTTRYHVPDLPHAADIMERFRFNFKRDLIVSVELTNPDFTINAYQNYTTGKISDLQQSMGRYANMVTITYADGSRENKPFPWGYPGSGYTARYVPKGDLDAWWTAWENEWTANWRLTKQASWEATWQADHPGGTAADMAADKAIAIAAAMNEDKAGVDMHWPEQKTAPITQYDPTADNANHGVGTDYIFTQKYQIFKTDPLTGEYVKKTDGSGQYVVEYTFPIPVVGHMRVTPITVIDVTADDMSRTYPLNTVTADVHDANDLALPSQARIITDIVPSSVSLVTPIKGWRPVQPDCWTTGDAEDSKWPTGSSATAMNSLKAKNYVRPGTYADGDPLKDTEGYPFWPGANDSYATQLSPSHPDYAPGHYVGDYRFETAASNGGARQDILSADIQKTFPWLTMPFEPGSTTKRVASWDVGKALRRIVESGEYIDPKAYTVSYVSTVTQVATGSDTNGDGQPTLTLSVAKADLTNMAEGSVFRVWLPNGQELGTGQVAGGVTVGENWFNDPAATPASAAHVNGFYNTQRRAAVGISNQIFHLNTNPSDPAKPVSTNTVDYHNTQRETLRRYINLGGWYRVAICETPLPGVCTAHNKPGTSDPCTGSAATGATAAGVTTYTCNDCGADVTAVTTPSTPRWTDPIPVYVPPRRNEYQEDKIYNFVGENKGLFNWPGGPGSLLDFPRGDYLPVAPDASDTSGRYIGLPLYDVFDVNDGSLVKTTNAVSDPGDVYKATDDMPGGSPYELKSNVARHRESYGVETTYDGQTGAQPGLVFAVKMNVYSVNYDTTWKVPDTSERTHPSVAAGAGGVWPAVGDTVMKHGPTDFMDDYAVTGYGRVYQPDPDLKEATLRRQLPTRDPQLREKITLTAPDYDKDGVLTATSGPNAGNVELVTFNTVTEGYTVRQNHLLILTNVGDVDIYGLNIDSLVDGYPLKDSTDRTGAIEGFPEGGHFEITVPPAQFLPAGSSTTFVLTYVYDLRANNVNGGLLYRDKLYVTSTSHPDPGVGQDYLLDFDAELRVSPGRLHQVTVVYRPTDGTMGTAGLIVGEQDVNGDPAMNTTPTTRTYPEKESVYVMVNKVDEYKVKKMTAEINGTTVDLLTNNEYSEDLKTMGVLPNDTDFKGSAPVDDDTFYVFEMPNHDVTVYVDFYEPIESKLRLDLLIDFSAPNADPPDAVDLIGGADVLDGVDPNDGYDPTGVYEPADPGHIYKVWKKEFTGAPKKGSTAATGDYKDAAKWSTDHGNADEDFFLMTTGSAIPATRGGDVYNSSNSHYLVVIDAEDDLSQIKTALRNVKHHVDYRGTDATHPDGFNKDVEPLVNMTLYYKDQVLENWNVATKPGKPVYDNDHGYGPYDASGNTLRPQGRTADSTYHITGDCDPVSKAGFFSPDPGESAYVHITITYNAPSGAGADDDASGVREYFVEIHRKTKEPEVVLHYGNSPYGMIMNDPKFVETPASNSASDIQDALEETARKRTVAKTKFVERGYTFKGADVSVLPDAARGDLQKVTYWREAWVRNLGLFEEESLTGFHAVMTTDPDKAVIDMSDTSGKPVKVTIGGTDYYYLRDGDNKYRAVYEPDKEVYDPANNLDLNDYAFFAVLGEDMWEPGVISAKDSSGRNVSLYDITARGMALNGTDGVTLLDTAKTSQVDRFSGTKTEILDLGVAGQKLTTLDEHAATVTVATDKVLGVKQWPAKTTETTTTPAGGGDPVTTVTRSIVKDIRPGRYIIEYSYLDYDGVTALKVSRPFVILRKVGDVNADGYQDAIKAPATGNTAAKNDEYAIEDRVTHDPLGYEAGGWNTATKKETVYPYANIFKFRVTDVNNDRNINNIDANQVAKNVKDKGGWLRFYDPVNYGHAGSPITAPSP